MNSLRKIINNVFNLMKYEKLNLPKSLSKHIRKEKSRANKEIFREDEKKKFVKELYGKLLKTKNPSLKETKNSAKKPAEKSSKK